MLRAVAFCARAYVKFKSSGTVAVVDVTGTSDAPVEGTVIDTVVTGRPDISGGGLVTTGVTRLYEG